MASKLKIYACSGIGAAQAAKPVKYWTDGTSTLSNTQAINALLAEINVRYIMVSRLKGITPEEKRDLLNEIDMLSVCLDAAKRFAGDEQKLRHAGNVIGCMVHDKQFDFASLNENEREEHLDELIKKANEGYNDPTPCEAPTKFSLWWTDMVMRRDKVGLNATQVATIKKATKAVKGVGGDDDWKKDAELSEYLTRGSEYFLYTYFTEEQLKNLPSVFRTKRDKQWRTYNYCKSLFVNVYGSEAQMQSIIYAGIVDYFQATPEEVCDEIVRTGKAKGVGKLAASVIVAIITGVVTIVVGIISAICEMVARQDEAKYAALDKEMVNSSIPNPEDFDGLELGGLGGGNTNWLPIVAAGALLLFLTK